MLGLNTFMLPSLSWTGWIVLVAICVSIGELCWIAYCRTLHPLAKIPGPWLASFSRFWIWLEVRKGQLHEREAELHEKYGKLVRIAPNELSCSDTAAVKQLYRTRNPLEKSDFYSNWTNTAFGSKHKDNFSVTNEKEHASRRRIINHVYKLSNVLKSEKYIDQCSQLLMQRLGDFADNETMIDLGQWLQMYAFDVIGELYFGRMFGFLETGADHQSLIQSLDVLNPVMAGAGVSATYARPFIFMSAIISSTIRSALKSMDHVTNTAKACVNERQRDLEHVKEGAEMPRQDILQQLFDIVEVKGAELDFGVPEVQCDAWIAVFAGSETTAIAMRSILYHLSRSVSTMSLLQKEIDEAFPVSTHPLDEPIQYADAIKLPYLCATIKEAMRIHAPVGFTLPRISPAPEGLLIDGAHIAPGYRVGINAYIVQRDLDVFGADADTFRPSRWLAENTSVEELKEMDRCMLQFGGGTRTCIGKNVSYLSLVKLTDFLTDNTKIALTEIHKLIPQILRIFELIPADVNQQWKIHNYVFNKQCGLDMRLRRRSTVDR